VKQPDTPGVDVQSVVVVVEVLVEVLVDVLELFDVLVLLVLFRVLVDVVLVGGRTMGRGSPQWASEQETSSGSVPASTVTRHTLVGSAQCENGNMSRSQSVGISHRGPRGSTQIHPANTLKPCRVAWAA
jgi:hypothetical protein